ncbi:MAG: biotin--[acetyl-CoA-carboxylase] ligase [Gemmatimonadaceae bacterium]|nr:biotin--[acetyl-CoA-carboxylase] ligase [Gemmatimonadaceae bacterium]MCW5825038.1 biotin--[acetyl-CoA-carboxylase] ligase [Gemmatimonadaceae bacterium]
MSWFGESAEALARRLDLPRVLAEASVPSTMDLAHALAADGAAPGTLVLAEEQRAGRGRGGHSWQSAPRAGIWATLIERPNDPAALEVLSLRVGLRLAAVLERWTDAGIGLKWPNDLFIGDRKLAGVLIEARWRDQRPDWVAIGFGINLVVPSAHEATALVDASAPEVLAEVLPAMRAAAAATGPLSASELAAYEARDVAAGRAVTSPARGTVQGIAADGAVLIESNGVVTAHRSGSLQFLS